MADTPIDARRFSDKEVQAILQKAVERSPSRAMTKGEGISLNELKAIGEEVGIDPQRMEDAARAVAQHGATAANPFLGVPTHLNYERRVEGEYDKRDIAEILSLIRRTTGHQGEADEIHGTLEWSAKGEAGGRYLTLSARDGVTTIRGAANLSQLAVASYIPAGTVGLVTTIIGLATYIKDGSGIGLGIGLVTLPALYAIMRKVVKRVTEKEVSKLHRVVDGLAQFVKRSED